MNAKGKEGRGLHTTGEGIRSTDGQLRDGYGAVKCSTDDTVSNIEVTKYVARGVPEISWGSLCKVYDCLATTQYP